MTRARRSRGRLVALEGIDGAGKSTLLRRLAALLRARGWSVGRRREPTDPVLGKLAQQASVRDPWTGGIYFTVDRHLARPALARELARRDVVLVDRSFYSTLAYQGSALPPMDRRRLADLQRRATIVPDSVVLLDLGPREAMRRLGVRPGVRSPLERERRLALVATEYRSLARRGGWIVVDATRPRAEVAREVFERLERQLGPRRRRKRPPSRPRM
jgi:dTMP kinase